MVMVTVVFMILFMSVTDLLLIEEEGCILQMLEVFVYTKLWTTLYDAPSFPPLCAS